MHRVEANEPKSGMKLGLEEFRRLLRFYLSCIEEEDLRSLTLHLAHKHEAFISPWNHRETFFNHECKPLRVRLQNDWEQMFLRRGSAHAGEAERFFYGYPVFLDARDALTPLFFMEVALQEERRHFHEEQGVVLQEERRGEFVMGPVSAGEFYLNHHFFKHITSGIEELQLIQEELEAPFESFEARLEAAFGFLGISASELRRDDLDPFPGRRAERDLWLNRPLLFRSDRNRYTSQLRRELILLLRYESLMKRAPETALSVFLEGPPARAGPGSPELMQVLPLSEAQERAAQSALNEPLTVVTGPPGTGKSQVVVDVLLSCARAGRRVLFASKNNKAVDVVRERIREQLGPGNDWTLRLGNLDQMAVAREQISTRLIECAARPDASGEISAAEEKLAEVNRLLSGLAGTVGRLRSAHQALEEAERKRRTAAQAVSEAWMRETPASGASLPRMAELREIGREIDAYAREIPGSLGIWLRRLFFGRAVRRRLTDRLLDAVADLPAYIRNDVAGRLGSVTSFGRMLPTVHHLTAYAEWIEARNRAAGLMSSLAELPEAAALAERFAAWKTEKSEVSRQLLAGSWSLRVAEHRDQVLAAFETYHELLDRMRTRRLGADFVSVLKQLGDTVRDLSERLPVWIVTNLSVRRALPLDAGLFDLVVIDEASQCDIPSAIPLLFRARRALIIGDPMQLRHISSLRANREQRIARDAEVTRLLQDWSYVGRSAYDAAASVILAGGDEPALLDEHYRSHPAIIEFSNQTFYEGRLIPLTSVAALEQRLPGHEFGAFWYDVKGFVPPASRSAWNDAEVSAALSLFQEWWKQGLLDREGLSFGVVTPFRRQMDRLEGALQRRPWWPRARARVVVGTAHRFQGDECDVMVFSPVVAEGLGERSARWVAETDQLLNVAVTRARASLHVVGDFDACVGAGGLLERFARYVVNSGGAAGERSPARPRELESLYRLIDDAGLAALELPALKQSGIDVSVITAFGSRYDISLKPSADHEAVGENHAELRGRTNGSARRSIIRLDPAEVSEREIDLRARLARLA